MRRRHGLAGTSFLASRRGRPQQMERRLATQSSRNVMREHLGAPVILMYHSVRDTAGDDPFGIAITPERFESQIAYIASAYRIVPLGELIGALSGQAKTSGLAAITLDDGYRDNLDAAAATLRKHRAPATVFVPTGFLGRPFFWWDALYRLYVRQGGSGAAVWRALQGRLSSLAPGTAESPREDFVSVWDCVRRQPLEAAYDAVEGAARGLGAKLEDLPRAVTEDELSELARWPFEVGAHGVSHRPLPALTLAEAREEIGASRARLRDLLGRGIATFAYPFGSADRDTAALCRAEGFAGAVTVASDIGPSLSYVDGFQLPRINAGAGDAQSLAATIAAFKAARGDEDEARKAGGGALSAAAPPHGWSLFRTAPVARIWGWERGTPLDRPFIRDFIQTHSADLKGHVLEIKEPDYAAEFARPGARVDILDINANNPRATIIDDLQTCATIADATYDCIVLTQVLQLIPNDAAAIAAVARILKPGGVLLLTAAGITQTARTSDGQFHRAYFEPGLRRLLAPHFDAAEVTVEPHGNVGLAASFLMGLTVGDVPKELFAGHDDEYPIVFTVRAVKPERAPNIVREPSPT